MSDVTTPNPPPEGDAIEFARTAEGISQREAARRAKMSETRWRQITRGYHVAGGTVVMDWGPPDTLARMARAVNLDPEVLRQAGRDDAYEAYIATPVRADRIPDLTKASNEDLLAEIARRLQVPERRNHGDTTPTSDYGWPRADLSVAPDMPQDIPTHVAARPRRDPPT